MGIINLPKISDKQAVYILLHNKAAILDENLRAQIDRMPSENASLDKACAKYLVSIYGEMTVPSVNLARLALLECAEHFHITLGEIDSSMQKAMIRSAKEYLRGPLRAALNGIQRQYLHSDNDPADEDMSPPMPFPDCRDFYQLWNTTLSDIYNFWLVRYSPVYSKSTQGLMKAAWNYLRPLWGREVRSIKIAEVQELLRPLTPSMQKATKRMYAKLEHLAFGMDIIEREGAVFLQVEKETPHPRTTLSMADLEELYRHTGEWFVDVTLVLCYTGFRAGELIRIKKSDVNVSLSEITGGIKSRYGVHRIIPIHPKIMPIIQRWMDSEPGEWLIGKENGHPFVLCDIEHAVAMATAAYCSQTHIPHECRHTFYSNLQRSGETSAACAARLMGHNPYGLPVDIGVYSHPSPDQLKKAIHSLP